MSLSQSFTFAFGKAGDWDQGIHAYYSVLSGFYVLYYKEVETVQNIQSCLFSFKQLNFDVINYRDTSGTHTCVSLRVSVFDI